jgi:hypothetical protein
MFKLRHLSAFFFLLAFVIGIPSAIAANVHFVEEPTVSVDLDDFTVTVDGRIAGVGNKDVVVTVEIQGSAEIWLYNPGGHLPAGKNKVPFYDVESVVVHPDAKNGTVPFSVTVDFSALIDGAMAQSILPNPNWTAVLQDVEISSVKVTIKQGGKTVLTQTFNP